MLITFENLNVVNKLLSNNAYDIPKLAKEVGFYFSLRKGRIDWRKIDNIDIDNLIHERDFVNLEDNINNVINCNLDSEYDLKILDPNFIKLFKLAQLSTEYLVYMQDYLLKCLQSAQLQLKESLQENEKLKLENTKKDEDIKSLKKKMKEKENLSLLIQQLNLQSHGGCFHQCSICGKTFINAKFLQAHHERRHPESPDLQEPERQQNSTMFDTLLNEVKILKERLSVTERLLEENKENNNQTLKQMEEEYEKKLEVCRSRYIQQLTDEQNRLQQNMEIENIRNPLENEQLQQMIDSQENQIKSLQEAMNSQVKENLEILKNKLEEQDSIWQKRVEEMASMHQDTVENLKGNQRTESSKVSTNDVNMLDYENKILELKSMASIQEQQLNQQKIELKMLRDELDKVSAAHMSMTNLKSKHAFNVSEKPVLVQSIISYPSRHQEAVTNEETSSESTESSEQQTVVTSQLTHQQHSKYPIDLKNYHKQVKEKIVSTPTSRKEPDIEESKKPIPVSSKVFDETGSVDDGTEESSSTPSSETSTDESQVPDIERLKKAVASNPHILIKLKEDLQSLMNQRLRHLGIDPEWSGVPQATYAQKMVTLQHQQNLTAKRYSDYFKIRKYYLNQLKCKVPDAVPAKSTTHKEPANVHGPEKIDSHASQIDKIMNRVKNKAQKVLHPVKDEVTHTSSLLQHDNREKSIKIQKPSKLSHEYGDKNSRNIKNRTPINEQGFNVKSGKPSPMHGHRDFSSKENLAMNIRPVTAKQSGEKIMKENGHTMLTSTPFNKRSTTNSESSSPLSSTIPSPIPVVRNVLGSGESRSVLKTSSTPNRNQAKKRVVFEDEDKIQQTSKQLTEVESWDSPNEEEKLQVQDDSSISSDEILPQRKMTPSSTSIKLKTKQSATIAQLASDLNDQLKSRTTKPIGGVDTAFSSESSSGPLKDDADKGKGGGKTVNNSKPMQLSDWDLEDLDTFE